MKIIITKNARRLVGIFAKEVRLQQDRVEGGFITAVNAERALIERLVAIGKKDPAMQAFLTYSGPIDKSEDEDPTASWADDPREGRRHVVNNTPHEGKIGVPNWDAEIAWPEPGERIA